MSAHFEELGWRQTPMGVISLRRRFDLSVRSDVYEVKLDDEYLMSSLFTVAERELARLALARTPGRGLDVIVGGLGLGYTAQEALECKRIRTLTVIEYSDAVIDWHERGLLPDTVGLAADTDVRPEQTAASGVATAGAAAMPSRSSCAIASWPAASTSRLSGKCRKNVLFVRPARSAICATVVSS